MRLQVRVCGADGCGCCAGTLLCETQERNETTTSRADVHVSELQLFDPSQAEASALRSKVIALRQQIPDFSEDELDRLEAWLVGVAKRLRQLKQSSSEAEASRVMTIRRLGELLGPGVTGRPKTLPDGNDKTLPDGNVLSAGYRKRCHAARLLAEFGDIVDQQIGEFLSAGKPAISLSRMVRICQRRRSAREVPFTDRLYALLYVDPPWQYEGAESGTRQIENQYGTMPLDEIKALSIPSADDATLFMWTTSPKLADGLALVKSWEFEYRTCMVWVKNKIGMGYYARQQHELLLIAKRGQPILPAPSNRPPSVFYGDRGEHSAKPERAYELIEAMYPEYERSDEFTEFVELFARVKRAGWDAWGLDTA